MSFARHALLAALLAACGLARLAPARAAEEDANQSAAASADADQKDDKKSDSKKGDNKSDDAKKADDKKDEDKKDEPAPSVTHGVATIDGREIAYTATAGKMLMATDEGQPKAHVFYIAYTLDDKDKAPSQDGSVNRDAATERGDDDNDSGKKKSDKKKEDPAAARAADEARRAAYRARPVTFCFNGGPGSSSVWLHLGMLGPIKVKLDSDAGTLPPPHELIANPYSLLDVTDLVFIDPVSTGFSRPAKGEDGRQFHGYEQDLRSVAQFIHEYTTKYARWGSPKFLLGESYGGIRAAGLSGELRERYHLELNGLVIVSGVIDFQTLSSGGSNDVYYTLFLPSYAATAWYHKALDKEMQAKSLEDVVKEAEQFAAGPYVQALAAGDSLPANRRRRIIRRMAELTGLSEDYIDAANLRVSNPQFGKELLRKRDKVVGRFDSRYTGVDADKLGEYTEHDPSGEAVYGVFTSALNDYVRTTLKVDDPHVYEILTSNVRPWDYSQFTNGYADASEALHDAMTQNPYLNVFAACGYYDLACPEFAMQFTRDHLNLPPEMRDRFHMAYYEAGHMMYVNEGSLKKLRKDLLKFYDETLRASAKKEDKQAKKEED